VYERLVVCSIETATLFEHFLIGLILQHADPENGPDLVIGADTVVLTHAQPVSSDVAYSELPNVLQELLEKPENKSDNLRMLQDLNGSVCEVVTGVSLGETIILLLPTGAKLTLISYSVPSFGLPWVRYSVSYLSTEFWYVAPDQRSSLEERSLVYFSDNPTNLLNAYVDSGEGLDRAGGFAVQVRNYTHTTAASRC
jgi:septum formation protein